MSHQPTTRQSKIIADAKPILKETEPKGKAITDKQVEILDRNKDNIQTHAHSPLTQTKIHKQAINSNGRHGLVIIMLTKDNLILQYENSHEIT